MSGKKINVEATGAALGALAFWSLGPIFIKYLTPWVDSWTQNCLRYSAAALFWLPLVWWSMRRGRFDRQTWKRAVWPAAANVVMQSIWAAAFYYLKPAFMTLLLKTNIVWVAVFSVVLFPAERALLRSRRFWAGLAMSILGVAGVLCYKQDFSAEGTATGIALTLVVAMTWSVYIVAAKLALKGIDSRHGFAVVSIYTTAGLWVLALLFGDLAQSAQMPARGWVAVVVSAVLCISLAHALFYAAIGRIGATIPTLVTLAQPGLVLAISSVMFHERLVPMQLAAGAVLLAGAAMAIWAQEDLGKCDTEQAIE